MPVDPSRHPVSFNAEADDHALAERQFVNYLRALEAPFLANYAHFGARSHRVVAEALFRELVLAEPDDRKIMGMRIVEEYLNAAGDLIGLFTALRRREEAPVIETFMAYRLDTESVLAFNAQIAGRLPEHVLRDLGLPAQEDVEASRDRLPPKDYQQLLAAVRSVSSGLQRATRADQSALLLLADGLRESTRLTNTLDWLPDRALNRDQVALMILARKRRSFLTHALSINERQIEQFVLAAGALTQASRDLIWLYLHMQDA